MAILIGIRKLPWDNMLVKFPTEDRFPTLLFTFFFLNHELTQQEACILQYLLEATEFLKG